MPYKKPNHVMLYCTSIRPTVQNNKDASVEVYII